MALVNFTTSTTNGVSGISNQNNVIYRNGYYYIIYVSQGALAFGNTAMRYKKSITVEGLYTAIEGTILIRGYSQDDYDNDGRSASAFDFRYDETNDRILFATSGWIKYSALSSLRTSFATFDGSGDIVMDNAFPHTVLASNGASEKFGCPRVCLLGSGKWVILSCELLYLTSPYPTRFGRVRVYISDRDNPSAFAHWTGYDMLTSAAQDLSTAMSIQRVADGSDDFVVVYYKRNSIGGYIFQTLKSKRFDFGAGTFGAEVDIGLSIYDSPANQMLNPDITNMELNSSGIPYFVAFIINTNDDYTEQNKDMYLCQYAEATDSWVTELQSDALFTDHYPYHPVTGTISFYQDYLFLVYGDNITAASTAELCWAYKPAGESWVDIRSYLDADMKTTDIWYGNATCNGIISGGKAIAVFVWLNRFGAPDHNSIYMTSKSIGAFGLIPVVNAIRNYNGLMCFASENTLEDGLFAHRLDREANSGTDLIELVDDTASLDL